MGKCLKDVIYCAEILQKKSSEKTRILSLRKISLNKDGNMNYDKRPIFKFKSSFKTVSFLKEFI